MLQIPVSVDIAVFRVHAKQLQVLLVKREATSSAYPGQWGLAGGTLDATDADLLQAVHRTLKRRVGSDLAYVEQVATEGSATRDPRGWSMTTLYFALVGLNEKVEINEQTRWVSIDDHQVRALAFDHSHLLQMAVQRFRNKTVYSLLPAYLLPNDFTYTELHETYQIILGRAIDESKFRTKLKAHPDLILGEKRTGVAYRAPVMLRVSPTPFKLLFPKPLV